MIYLNNIDRIQTVYIPRNEELVGNTPQPCSCELAPLNIIVTADTITDIRPEMGYDGYYSINIDATDYAQQNYDAGYDDGLIEGLASGETVGYESGYTSGYSSGYTSGSTDGYNSGYTSGETDGYNNGYISGSNDGFNSGYTSGYSSGYTSGYSEGFDSGYTDGYASGETVGYESGYTDGYDSGSTDGFQSGYTSGNTDGYESGKTDGYSSGYTSGYNSGYTSGETHQKSLLVSTAITQNGSYSMENGYSAITVNVQQTGHTDQELENAYNSGHTEGMEDQKALLSSTALTENGSYTRENGWSGVTVNVDTASTYNSGYTSGYTDGYDSGYTSGNTDGFNSGYTSGETHQKSLFISTAFTENGEYQREDGWSSVTVNVPQSGSTAKLEEITVVISADTTNVRPSSGYDGMSAVTIDAEQYGQDNYENGFDDGFVDGYASGSTDERGKLSAVTFSANTAVTMDEGGYSAITVNVPQTGHTDQELEDAFESGYTSGHTEGMDDQKELLVSTAFTENGDYTRENGWSGVTVNVDTASTYNSGYTSGYTDGYDSGSTDGYNSGYTSGETDGYNSGYTSGSTDGYNSGYTEGYDSGYTSGNTDGYDSGYTEGYDSGYTSGNTDGYSSGYTSGHTDGVSEEKAKLSATTFTANTAVTISDGGYSAITVNVPHTGYTQEDLDNAYASGETVGENTIIATFSSMTATTNGVYGSSAHPLSSITVNVPTTVNPNIIAERNFCCSNPTINTTNIQEFAFEGANLTGVLTIGSAVTNIYAYAFRNTPITAITFPQTIVGDEYGKMVMAGYGQFSYTNIVTLDVPNYLEFTEIGLTINTTGIFESCTALTTVNWKVYRVPMYTFRYCSSLSAITLVDVEYIDRNAFTYCSSLTQINCSSTIAPTITNENAFQGVPSTGTVHYPQGSDYSSWQSNTYLSGWTFTGDL